MQSDTSKIEIESEITLLIPDREVRRLYLSVFVESLTEAHSHGANKWGVYYIVDANRLRLLVGSIIVLTVHKQGLWMALDHELLQKSKEEQNMLNLSNNWRWDTDDYPEYTRIPSINGYYMPSPSGDYLQIWPTIRQHHFAYVGKVAKKFSQLREDSQQRHMPEVLVYLRQELNRYVPEPVYDEFVFPLSNPIREIREYESSPQNQNLQKTERESIIQSRVGQEQFRTGLIRYWGKCAVTNCQKAEILRASHIKPWRESSNTERQMYTMDCYSFRILMSLLIVDLSLLLTMERL
ncbi:MAG: hypothetical protein IT327_32825 [Anaerolineae bacterium]|nr:hypothetical protein [Anaerolineae bacterium]